MTTFGVVFLCIVGLMIRGIFKLLKRIIIFVKNSLFNNTETRHKTTPTQKEEICHFSDGISQAEFSEIVVNEARSISRKRLKAVSVHDSTVYGTVCSESGLSDWSFSLDFNDFGHLTGRFWTHSENFDSVIPKVLGDLISNEVHRRHS